MHKRDVLDKAKICASALESSGVSYNKYGDYDNKASIIVFNLCTSSNNDALNA